MPPPKQWATTRRSGRSATPDLIVKPPRSPSRANAPDWWGEIPRVPIRLTEDRYVAALEIKEVNDVDTKRPGRATVGGRYVFHHMIWGTRV